MWNNQKQQKLFSLVSNLQTYYHFKLDFQKVDQHMFLCFKNNQIHMFQYKNAWQHKSFDSIHGQWDTKQ